VTDLVLAIAALAVVYLGIRVARRYAQLRGTRVVRCPETNESVGVEVDAGRAALGAAFGTARFELTDCTRWPERRDCGRECLGQIEAAPVDCLVRTKLTAWYAGKACAVCGKPIGAVDWAHHRPALATPEHRTIGWQEVAAERLAEVLGTHKPVCWDCHVTETFRRQHPELVLDSPWQKNGTRSPTSHA
jgi:hypothetical protein